MEKCNKSTTVTRAIHVNNVLALCKSKSSNSFQVNYRGGKKVTGCDFCNANAKQIQCQLYQSLFWRIIVYLKPLGNTNSLYCNNPELKISSKISLIQTILNREIYWKKKCISYQKICIFYKCKLLSINIIFT